MDLFKFYGILLRGFIQILWDPTPWIYLNSMWSYSMDLFKFYGILSVFTPWFYLKSMESYYMVLPKFYGILIREFI